MSWSNTWIGKPSAIAAAMDRYSDVLQGDSKAEYDAVKDHIKALAVANDDAAVVHVDANGHAYDGTSTCNVSVKRLGHLLTE